MSWKITNKEFRALLTLMMCSDPWPIPPDTNGYDGHGTLLDFIDRESNLRGYDDWIEAYHDFEA
jgi:hypothetical protein